MEINGNQLIESTQQVVWDSLNSPEILKRCLPGCESVEAVTSEEFKIVLMAVVGPLAALALTCAHSRCDLGARSL